MSLAAFAEHINGEFVAGCLIGTINGKRQYLHRDGQFTPEGLVAYREWEDSITEVVPEQPPEPEMAIATADAKVRGKSGKRMGIDHG